MYKNRITLIGFLGKDADAKSLRSGQRYTILSLATQESWKDKESGEYIRRTEWHRIVCWGRLGEFAAILVKGAHLEIEGTLRSREYTPRDTETAANGRKGQPEPKATRVWEIRAESILKLDRVAKQESDESTEPSQADQEVPF